MRAWAVAVLVALAGCQLGPSHWVSERGEFSVPVDGVQATRTMAGNGGVRVSGDTAARDIRVRYERRGGARSDEEARLALAQIEVTHTTNARGQLDIAWRWTRPPDTSWGGAVNFWITQPKGIPTSIETHNGAVAVVDCDAQVDARTHNGQMTITGCVGEVLAVTHNGALEVSGPLGRVRLETHNGSVRANLTGPAEPQGSITTHNGSITVGIREGTPVRIEASTQNGSVSARREFARITASRSRLSAATKNATGELRLQTHNGNIRIH